MYVGIQTDKRVTVVSITALHTSLCNRFYCSCDVQVVLYRFPIKALSNWFRRASPTRGIGLPQITSAPLSRNIFASRSG